MDTLTLASLVALLDNANLLEGTHNITSDNNTLVLSGADCDSRVVAPGHLFICKGAAFKPAYLAQAIEHGAVAYLCEAELAPELAEACPGVPALIAKGKKSLRTAMAIASKACWGCPDDVMPVVGVTGTKGKSTTTYLLRSILDARDKGADGAEPGCRTGVGIIGSIRTYDGVEELESHNTTPEAPDLWRHLANARMSGATPVVMEVSSQALKYERCLGLNLAVAGWLNIGRDHISPVEHPDFEDYFASKLKIFELSNTAVINVGTEHLDEVLAAAEHCGYRVLVSADGPHVPGHSELAAEIYATDVAADGASLSFMCHTPSWTGPLTLSFPGSFNVENALVAVAFAQLLGVGYKQIAEGLASCRVPGRMEVCEASTDSIVGLVDYAHNKLSFNKFFSSVAKEFSGYAIVAVTGAAGGKAYERRSELPQEASKWADMLIYTTEDPGPERPEDICAEMAHNTPDGQAYEIQVDRSRAIERAVAWAKAQARPSVVCMLAKGDEIDQHVGNAFVPMEPDGVVFNRVMRGE